MIREGVPTVTYEAPPPFLPKEKRPDVLRAGTRVYTHPEILASGSLLGLRKDTLTEGRWVMDGEEV